MFAIAMFGLGPRTAATSKKRSNKMSSLILVVDDESDVEMLFRQQFRRDLRAGRFTMDFGILPSQVTAPFNTSMIPVARRWS